MNALLVAKDPKDASAARACLCQLAGILAEVGPMHAAMHDVLMLYGHTQHFFAHAKYGSIAEGSVSLSAGSGPSGELFRSKLCLCCTVGFPIKSKCNLYAR